MKQISFIHQFSSKVCSNLHIAYSCKITFIYSNLQLPLFYPLTSLLAIDFFKHIFLANVLYFIFLFLGKNCSLITC